MSIAPGTRVLLVEDEVLIAMMAGAMLTECGATVVGPAHDIPSALRLAETAEIEAAVLDINIRGEQSFEVARVLRGRGVPLVFATGYGNVDLAAFPEAHLINKPYTQANLEAALDKVM